MSRRASKSKRAELSFRHAIGAVAIVSGALTIFAAGCGDGGTTNQPTCSDGVQNGGETGVDCGGRCSPCMGGNECEAGSQCSSGVCENGVCQAPTCSDGVKNGDETTVDCGPSCATAETCNGKDDDCNGSIDDGIESITCGKGTCQRTVDGCTDGKPSLCEPGQAGVETCDGLLDEDCDGAVDNGCSCTDGDTQACYTGSSMTMGVGACIAGTQTCENGAWGDCIGEVTPASETCDGIDNDCNGSVDDGLPSISCGTGACAVTIPSCENGQETTCTPADPTNETCDGLDNDCNGTVDDGIVDITCGVGACAVTVSGCDNGQVPTCTPADPTTETCDGIDNNCNGMVDDGIGGDPCNTGKDGICAAGTTGCMGGMTICNQNAQPSAEICDGTADENCDGQIDDGCQCTNGSTQACYTGAANTQDVGPCHGGTQTCSNGAWSTCAGEVVPTSESCDGIDNDCNGQIDNGNPDGGASCSTGLSGICAAGTLTCSGGAVSCVQNQQPTTESCATTGDDNCNGQANEGCVCTPFATQSCYTGQAGTAGVGICKSGTRTCNSTGTAWGACSGEVLPGTESCKNNLDDDCDGSTNEGCSALTCQNFYFEDFNDGTATSLTSGVYKVDWCNSYVATAANTPLCLLPGQTTRTNANGGTNTYVGIWVSKATASCSSVRLSYDWYQFALAGAVVEYKQTTDTFASYTSCNNTSGWTTAVASSSMSTLQTCSSTSNINIPFGSSPAVYIKFKSTNAQNNAMWWDDISLTLVGCDC